MVTADADEREKVMLGRTTLWMEAFVLLVVVAEGAHAGVTADSALKKGFLRCGVNTGLAGFSQPDSHGEWRGIDVVLPGGRCRAVRRRTEDSLYAVDRAATFYRLTVGRN